MTSLEWLRALRSDIRFEQILIQNGIVKERYRPLTKTPINAQASRAVWHLYQNDVTRIPFKALARTYCSNLTGLKDALVWWFSENWERWMNDDGHD